MMLGVGCVHPPGPKNAGKPKPVKVSQERADKVEQAASAALGHDKFSVCYVEVGSVVGPDVSLQEMVGLGNLKIGKKKDQLTMGMSAGFADNQKIGMDVVMDGPDPDKSDRLAREALEMLNTPLPGLDLVLLQAPSPGLQATAQKYGVSLHVISINQG